jgi:hypothetical protein
MRPGHVDEQSQITSILKRLRITDKDKQKSFHAAMDAYKREKGLQFLDYKAMWGIAQKLFGGGK